jgi:hypothetical protein
MGRAGASDPGGAPGAASRISGVPGPGRPIPATPGGAGGAPGADNRTSAVLATRPGVTPPGAGIRTSGECGAAAVTGGAAGAAIRTSGDFTPAGAPGGGGGAAGAAKRISGEAEMGARPGGGGAADASRTSWPGPDADPGGGFAAAIGISPVGIKPLICVVENQCCPSPVRTKCSAVSWPLVTRSRSWSLVYGPHS